MPKARTVAIQVCTENKFGEFLQTWLWKRSQARLDRHTDKTESQRVREIDRQRSRETERHTERETQTERKRDGEDVHFALCRPDHLTT